jgi:hypothetical protein
MRIFASTSTHLINYAPATNNNSYQTPSLADMYLTSQGYTQALVKISSYGKGKTKVCNHLSYISRKGELDLEDQDGTLISGLEAQERLVDDWAADFGDNARSRDTVHMVLSTLEGTDPEQVKEAAREFLAKEFQGNHPYVFALHEDTGKPHVHVAVKMKGEDGKKLDPRKADLDRMRKRFAEICRSKGIKLEAIRRYERGLGGKSTKSELYQMKRRGKKPDVDSKLEKRVKEEVSEKDFNKKPWEDKMKARNQLIRKRYIEAARKAAQAAKNSKEKPQKKAFEHIAKSLDSYAKNMPVEASRDTPLKAAEAQNNNLNHEAERMAESQEKSYNEYMKIKQELSGKKLGKIAENDLIIKKQNERDMDI